MLTYQPVFHCMQGGKPENANKSFTPLIGERLTDIQPKRQWTDIDWKKVFLKKVNRLQTRITNEMLERYEGKLSHTVLRRGGASNRPICNLLLTPDNLHHKYFYIIGLTTKLI